MNIEASMIEDGNGAVERKTAMHDTKEKAVAAWNRRVNNDKA